MLEYVLWCLLQLMESIYKESHSKLISFYIFISNSTFCINFLFSSLLSKKKVILHVERVIEELTHLKIHNLAFKLTIQCDLTIIKSCLVKKKNEVVCISLVYGSSKRKYSSHRFLGCMMHFKVFKL